MKLILAVLTLISVDLAAADCPKAADWARAFYSEHYSFYAEPSDTILQFTTPEFGALLKREWAYSNGELGHLDYDPWLGGQDGKDWQAGSLLRGNGVAGFGNCLHVISVRARLQAAARTAHGALGIAQARTRVLAASRFHHAAWRFASIYVFTSAALTNR